MEAKLFSAKPHELAVVVRRCGFRRRVNAIHVHQTRRPDQAQFSANPEHRLALMRQVHVQRYGWRDLAQHVTVAPDGAVWLGRNWNLPPCSVAGKNGGPRAGPFMVMLVGDFTGGERPTADQRQALLEVCAAVCERFELQGDAVQFCGGLAGRLPGLTPRAFIRDLARARKKLSAGEDDADESKRPFGPQHLHLQDMADAVCGDAAGRGVTRESDPEAEDAQINEDDMSELAANFIYGTNSGTGGTGTPGGAGPAGGAGGARGAGGSGARGGGGDDMGLTPDQLRDIADHVINLNMGRFSSDGFKTQAIDVDRMFNERITKWFADRPGKPKRLLFFAHGGLVKESAGLQIAHKHVAWWRDNGVYPVYFVWETGLMETLNQLLSGARGRALRPFAGARDFADWTTDPLIERTARLLGGPRIWGGMKDSARAASEAPDGGAHYTAGKLAAFRKANPDVEFHAVGHSAGSIFHAHFIPAALAADPGIKFKTVSFLAPAIRADLFLQNLHDRVGKEIENLRVYTMRKELEKSDFCGKVGGVKLYNKSLLYLIYYGLEPERETDILGLEASLRSRPRLAKLFGLQGQAGPASVVWSQTAQTDGPDASRATEHGGFDDDAPTMNSVLRAVTQAAPTKPFPGTRDLRGLRDWDNQRETGEDEEELADAPAGQGAGTAGGFGAFGPAPVGGGPPPRPSPAPAVWSPGSSGVTGGGQGGRRRALCVGINNYPGAQLFGCVADAENWAQTLRSLGFELQELLRDHQATRANILRHLGELVGGSRAGDVIVFQFAGHGTQLPDQNGDEVGGDSPGEDEAIVPFDYTDGPFVLDDDVAEVFARLPGGVNLTCFIDCCHSGTISRFAVGTSPQPRGQHDRVRFMPATPAMRQAHAEFRKNMPGARAAAGRQRGPEQMREVVFSACMSREVAYESGGSGDFTRMATDVLRTAAGGQLTHEQFLQGVRNAFGPTPRQHPTLDCAPPTRAGTLLSSLSQRAGGAGGPARGVNGLAGGRGVGDVLRALADVLENGNCGQ